MTSAVYGSPRNKDHGRPCGCSIRFRGGGAGYDVYNCSTHEAGPDLLAALESTECRSCGSLIGQTTNHCPGCDQARAAVDRAKGRV